jgi:ech hydrogenase subunit F
MKMPWMFFTIWKNLLSRPATRRYPFKDIREPFPGYRGKIIFDASKCDFCGAYAKICPSVAIEVKREEKQIIYNPFKCLYCGTCVETCHLAAIRQDGHYASPAIDKQTETTSLSV